MAEWLEYYFSSIHVLTGVNMFGLFGKEMRLLLNHTIFQCTSLNMHPCLSLLKAKLKKYAYWLDCVIAEQNNVVESHNVKRKVILDHI